MLRMHKISIVGLALALAACGGGEPAEDEGVAEESAGQETEESAADAPAEEAAVDPQLLAEGTPAPDFTAPDQSGTERTLSAERGHVVVLYFYPRDATPGCTAEACAFRDAWSRYEEAGVTVFGVSVDDVESHRAFAEEHELPFALLADTDVAITDAYGARAAQGDVVYSRRVTYVIDAEGNVARVFDDVDPGVHADEVLAAIEALR